MADWQLIETAPKNDEGPFILACKSGSKIPAITAWDEDEGWFTVNGFFKGKWEPTHWMPLEPPPAR